MTLNTVVLLKDKINPQPNLALEMSCHSSRMVPSLGFFFPFFLTKFPHWKTSVPVLLGITAFYYVIPLDVAVRCTD